MTTTTAPAALAKLTNVELNSASYEASRRHGYDLNHPSVQVYRDEMRRRTIAEGHTPIR